MVIPRVIRKQGVGKRTTGTWSLIHENQRDMIEQWRENRSQSFSSFYSVFTATTFTFETVKSFIQNINFMVLVHIIMSVTAVYIFQKFDVSFDTNVALFVSPVVFPLAFSINSDFQRREKVLEDLATFKSAGISWYFCMREWKTPAGLDSEWMREVHKKLKSVLFYLCEYLLTHKVERRNIILRAIYEDFSDANELVEKLRASKLPTNTAAVSRSIHLLHTMGLSFERLRVIRDYRSPRSIRSFNKVFILMLPIILGPYFVHLGHRGDNCWQSYYLAVILAFVFSTLQVVQDKLDDPFDGMGEDDINVDTIDEWAPILERKKDRKQPNWNVPLLPCQPFFDMETNDRTPYNDSPKQNSCSTKSQASQSNRVLGENDVTQDIINSCDVINSSNFTVYSSPEVNETKDGSCAELRMEEEKEEEVPLTEDQCYDPNTPDVPKKQSVDNGRRTPLAHLKLAKERVRRSLTDAPPYKHLPPDEEYTLKEELSA